MKRIAVDSSSIQTIGYDPTREVLEIEFINDHVYRYHPVSELIYFRLMKAHSIGAFFNEKIKDGGYSFEKIK